MGVFTAVGKLFKPQQTRGNANPAPAAPGPNTPEPTRPSNVPRQQRPGSPVAVDLYAEDDPDAELEGFDPGREPMPEVKPPRSRQELIAELQQNYREVLGIVRKVDSHLDEQGQRAGRIAEIAERFPAAADDLALLRERQDAAHGVLESVAVSLRERDASLTESQLATLDRLDEIRGLMAESSESERQLVGSLVEFRDTMGGMSAATERLSEAVERIEAREAERVQEIVNAIGGIKGSVVGVGIVAASCAVVAMVLGFLALTF